MADELTPAQLRYLDGHRAHSSTRTPPSTIKETAMDPKLVCHDCKQKFTALVADPFDALKPGGVQVARCRKCYDAYIASEQGTQDPPFHAVIASTDTKPLLKTVNIDPALPGSEKTIKSVVDVSGDIPKTLFVKDESPIPVGANPFDKDWNLFPAQKEHIKAIMESDTIPPDVVNAINHPITSAAQAVETLTVKKLPGPDHPMWREQTLNSPQFSSRGPNIFAPGMSEAAVREWMEHLDKNHAGKIISLPGKTPELQSCYTLVEHETFNGYTYSYTFSAPTMDEVFEMRCRHQTKRKLERDQRDSKTS